MAETKLDSKFVQTTKTPILISEKRCSGCYERISSYISYYVSRDKLFCISCGDLFELSSSELCDAKVDITKKDASKSKNYLLVKNHRHK